MLAEVHERKRFILQGGDCAEQFEACSSTAIENKLKIIMQMSLVVSKAVQFARSREGEWQWKGTACSRRSS